MPTLTPLDIEHKLNPEQIAAVTHGEGPELVLAGAGSGKTRVITYRIAWLVRERGVDPASIVAVTFTNKAAAEMRERAENLLKIFPLPAFVGTFHRFCLTLLRRYGDRLGLRRDFAILDSDDQTGLMKKALQAEQIPETAFPPRTVLSAVSSAKNQLIGVEQYEKNAANYFETKVAKLYRRYQHLLREVSGVDFDDMIALAVKLLAEDKEVGDRVRRRVRYLLVDEFQDTNHAQLRLVNELAGASGNLTAVGDEDQGIYRWRGADLDNILRFEDGFPGATVRKLERNYRSTQSILDASGAVVKHNQGRRGKVLWTENGPGQKLELYKASDEQDEARWVVNTLQGLRAAYTLSGMAILVRTNAQTRSFEEELLRKEVPYTLVGGVRFYERAEIKDLIAYLRVLRNPRDGISLLRILNVPARGIGKGTQELLEQRATELGTPLWDVLATDDLGRFAPRATKALEGFRDIIKGLQAEAQDLPLPAVLDRLLVQTRFLEQYRREDPEDEARLENIREFLSAAQEFTEREAVEHPEEQDALTSFLDHVSLVADLDGWQAERGITLMTLHSAKGLEFPAVVVAGLEDGILPHFNSGGRTEDVEEERRLLYVGMTRARERLFLTCCRRRRIAGRYQDQMESPFLEEVPPELVDVTESPDLHWGERTRPVYGFFNRSAPEGGAAVDDAPAWIDRNADRGSWRGTGLHTPAKADRLQRGARVRHATLGEGVVMEVDGSGDEAKITVYFERAGRRKLIAKFAGLEQL
ncbi:MAG: UvrD-helicase domain-containing protein [Acidobacteriota bacterium]